LFELSERPQIALISAEFSLTPRLQPGDWRWRKVLTVSTVCRVRETIETVLSFTAQIHPTEAGC
jgi:hypothetical protein